MASAIFKKENNNYFIDGVPPLKWGNWKDLSYISTLAQIFKIIGTSVTYEDLMGASGLCYQFSLMPDYDYSSALPQNGVVRDDLIYAAVGYEGYTIKDSETRTQKIKESIAKGFPIACMGQHSSPEWGMLLGYNNDNNEFFGRSFLDKDPHQDSSSNSVQYATENKYQMATDYPGNYPDLFTILYDKECTKAPAEKLLHSSLELCRDSFYYAPSSEAVYGKNALELLLNGFSDSYTKLYSKINFNAGILLDSRRAAYIYLEQHSGDAGSDYKDSIMNLSSTYKKLFNLLNDAIPYNRCYSNEQWDTETRKKVTNSLQQALEIEKYIHELVTKILSKLEA